MRRSILAIPLTLYGGTGFRPLQFQLNSPSQANRMKLASNRRSLKHAVEQKGVRRSPLSKNEAEPSSGTSDCFAVFSVFSKQRFRR